MQSWGGPCVTICSVPENGITQAEPGPKNAILKSDLWVSLLEPVGSPLYSPNHSKLAQVTVRPEDSMIPA